MAYVRADLSARQRTVLGREQRILAAAEHILVTEGFLDMSMARLAQASKCARGTIYHHFSSREDVVVAIACKAWKKRLELMERGARYSGATRIRMAGVAEGFSFFYSLYPAYFSILHKANGTICEKASPVRLEALRAAERRSADIVRELIEEGLRAGDLRPAKASIDQMLFAYCALATGGFDLHEVGFPQVSLHRGHAMDLLRESLNLLGDAFGWHPLTDEVDWEATSVEIRRAVFPEETQQVFGPGQWHGEWGVRLREPLATA